MSQQVVNMSSTPAAQNVPQSEAYPDNVIREMLEGNSSLFIDLSHCETLDTEILGTNTTIGHLPDETRVVIQMLHSGPMSMINYGFFKAHIYGKNLNWLNGQTIYYPEADKYKPACFLPMGDDHSDNRDYGIDISFRKSRGGTCMLHVWGIAEIPIFIGGLPLRISCLIVDCLPVHRTNLAVTQIPDVLLLASIFNGKTIPLRFHNDLIHCPTGVAANINTCVIAETNHVALEVYADVANTKAHKRGALYDVGYGVWFGEDSMFNTSGTMETGTPRSDIYLELRGALQVVYAVRDMSVYVYSHFDFTNVIIYCSSDHIVKWAPEWEAHWETKGWMQSLKLDQRTKDLWDELMYAQKAARRTFKWTYLEAKYNEEAIALSRTAVLGMGGPDWQVLMNETYCLNEVRKQLKKRQRPGNFFQGLSLEGGMCRKNHPKGFVIDTCCLCSSGRKGWERHIHF
ncbi:hypothetical protein Dda_5141 [Drechslerella dactyloides]|uniref:RNase H type-1 domain-containing protein n=1 Tax=Drechslerella dactyloides TaxID=74499 RepID=A0AAD6IX01_DREDA|nr:hypothetical protein Dda_5141 [Drechslerella dactyloides]